MRDRIYEPVESLRRRTRATVRGIGVCILLAVPPAVLMTIVACTTSPDRIQPLARAPAASSVAAARAFGKLPLAFEKNQGQTDARVDYLARGSGFLLFLTGDGAVLSFATPIDSQHPDVSPGKRQSAGAAGVGVATDPRTDAAAGTTALQLTLSGARSQAKPNAEAPQGGRSNYFTGSTPGRWVTDVGQYGRIRYADVYPGIDLVYYGDQRKLEYDFVVAPGADPKAIRMAFRGARSARLNDTGDLALSVGGREFVQRKPYVYQEIDGRKVLLAGNYVLENSEPKNGPVEVAFALGDYDRRQALVIDPVIVYSTYFEDVHSLAVDADGNVYVTGSTQAADFPVVGGLPPEQGGHPPTGEPPFDNFSAFVAKLNPQGDHLIYATYLSSNTVCCDNSAGVHGYSLKVDGEGAAYIAGTTTSADFPVVGGLPPAQAGAPDGSEAVFVAKLSPAGDALEYSTYLGAGNGREMLYEQALGVDAAGNAYVTGFTTPPYGFPVVGGLSLEQGGVPDGDGCIFVAKLNSAGDGLAYSTYLSGSEGFSQAEALAVDASDQVYIGGGGNTSRTLPRVGGLSAEEGGDPVFEFGVQPAYLAKLNAEGNALIYATYLSGGSFDDASAIALDNTGSLYVAGKTDSRDGFPIVGGLPPEQGGHPEDSCCGDVFVSKLNPDGNALVYSTLLGGNNIDGAYGLAVDELGAVYVTGQTLSTDFPQVNPLSPEQGGAQDSGPFGPELCAFVSKLDSDGDALAFSTYLCNNSWGRTVALDDDGNVYVAGNVGSDGHPFPIVGGLPPEEGGTQRGGFIAKLTNSAVPEQIFASGFDSTPP
jgi:hypothetical protein